MRGEIDMEMLKWIAMFGCFFKQGFIKCHPFWGKQCKCVVIFEDDFFLINSAWRLGWFLSKKNPCYIINLKWHFQVSLEHARWPGDEMGMDLGFDLGYEMDDPGHNFLVRRDMWHGCFLKWWYPQNTPKWSFLVGKPMVVGYRHFRKPLYD